MGLFAKSRGRVREKRLWLLVAALVVGGLGLFPAIGGLLEGLYRARIGLLVPIGYYAALFGLVVQWNRRWRDREALLRGDEQGLWVDGVLVVPRDTIRHAHLVRRDGGTWVRLDRLNRPVEVAVDDEAEAIALLRAMRVDAAQSIGQYVLHHGTYRSSWLRGVQVGVGALLACAALVLGSVYLGGGAPAVIGGVALLLSIVIAIAANEPVSIFVGADGFRLQRLLERTRFVPFSELVSAEIEDREVRLCLRDGSTIDLHQPASPQGRQLLSADSAEEGRMLVERLQEQAESHHGDRFEVGGLARGGRETRAWLRDVATVSDERASFRVPAVAPDVLWRVVADPSAAATARAGAALALRGRLDEPGRVRLGELAEACAERRLRVALTAAASPAPIEALEEAFEELDDDVPSRRRASTGGA